MLLGLPSQAGSFAPFSKWQDMFSAAKFQFAAKTLALARVIKSSEVGFACECFEVKLRSALLCNY